MADWVPVNPYFAPILPLPDEALQEEAWQEGADAMARAIIERYEALIDDPACESFRAAWAQVKRELGLADG